jgi:PAS domain S-box-containing protein
MIKKNISINICFPVILLGLIFGIFAIALDIAATHYFSKSLNVPFFDSGDRIILRIILFFLSMSFVLLLQILFFTEDIFKSKTEKTEPDLAELFGSLGYCAATYHTMNNGNTFIFEDFNSAAERAEKIKKSDVLGRNVLEIFPGIEKFGLLSVMKRVYATGTPESHDLSFYEDKRISGWRQNYVFKVGEGKIIAVYQDLTEKIETLARLRKTEADIGTIMKNLPIFFILVDGKDIVKNAMGKALADITHSPTIAGMKLEELFGAKSKFMESVAMARNGVEFSATIKIGDKVFEVSFSSVPYPNETGRGIVALGFDVTPKTALEKEKELLVTAINYVDQSVMITDTDGKIEYVNPAWEKMTGFLAGELIGEHPRTIKSGKHNEAFYKEIWTTLGDGRTWKGHFFNKKKDGSIYEEDAVISPVKNRHGDIINYVAVKKDVTQQVILQNQLLQAQKMEVVGRLAGGIAHDFNNILTVIIGYSELAMTTIGADAPSYDSIREIRAAGKRAASLTKQLLSFARRQIINVEPVSVREVFGEIEEMLRRIIGEECVVEFRYAGDDDTILAERSQMEQVLMNLVINAKDAMSGGGKIMISVESHFQTYPYNNMGFSAKKGNYIKISVCDHGTGMDEEVRSHLFEPFFSTKPKDKGTGLGLSTAYGIVKQHGGFISFDSVLGEGSTFNIFIPSASESSSQIAENSEKRVVREIRNISQGDKKTVLIAEDELFVQTLAAKILEKAGFNVLVANNGAEALNVLESGKEEVDFLLSDVIMPVMDGAKLAGHVMKNWPKIKILMMSGYADIDLPETADGEKTPCIPKPFSPEMLMTAIQEYFV